MLAQLADVRASLVVAENKANEASADAWLTRRELRRLLRHVEKHAREARAGVQCATGKGPLAPPGEPPAPDTVGDPMWQLARARKALGKLFADLRDDAWNASEAARHARQYSKHAELLIQVAAERAAERAA